MLKGLEERAAQHRRQRRQQREQEQGQGHDAQEEGFTCEEGGGENGDEGNEEADGSSGDREREEGDGEEEERLLLRDLRACMVRALLTTPGQMARGAAMRVDYGTSCVLHMCVYRWVCVQSRGRECVCACMNEGDACGWTSVRVACHVWRMIGLGWIGLEWMKRSVCSFVSMLSDLCCRRFTVNDYHAPPFLPPSNTHTLTHSYTPNFSYTFTHTHTSTNRARVPGPRPRRRRLAAGGAGQAGRVPDPALAGRGGGSSRSRDSSSDGDGGGGGGRRLFIGPFLFAA